jgi:hypothetical protein
MKKRDCFTPYHSLRSGTGFAMTALVTLLVAVVIAGCGKAESYGSAISNKVVTRVDDILRNPELHKGKTVTIKGKILNECSTGCWFDVKDGEAVIYTNIEAAGFAIPQKTGHAILVEGKVAVENGKTKIIGTGVEVK